MRADRNKSGPGAVLAEARLADVSQVSLYGNVQVSTQVVHTLLEVGVPIAYFTFGGWFNGMTLGLPSKNIELRRRQFLAAQNSTVCLELARTITAGKIENQRTLLRRNGAPDERTLEEMKRMAKRCEEAENLGALLGVEGNAARAYFSAFGSMLRPRGQSDEPGPFRFEFEKRNRRPPTDPVNALLSYAYSLLAKDLTVVCWAVGFDPYLGVYHQPRFGRPALALDLMEEFRPVIADSVVLTAINTGVVTGADFLRRGPAVALTPDGRKRFLQCYERRMDSLVTHPVFGYQISYRRVLDVQARLLARRLSGELPVYPAFTVR
jgi:CRISPR-associated protein Cas1